MEDINNYRQNNPELVVADLQDYVSPEIIRFSLKYRGVNKWLQVRRWLIQLKHRWKAQIQELTEQQKQESDIRKRYYIKGYKEALTNCRQQIRALCHSPRDVEYIIDLPIDFPQRPHKRYFCNHRKDGKDG